MSERERRSRHNNTHTRETIDETAAAADDDDDDKPTKTNQRTSKTTTPKIKSVCVGGWVDEEFIMNDKFG